MRQRDAGVAQRVDAGGDGQAGDAVERGDALRRNAELRAKIERAAARRQLDHVSGIVDRFEGGASVLALHQARDVLVEHGAAEARRNDVDELLAAQDAGDVAVIEDAVGPGQSQGRAGDHHRAGERAVCPTGSGFGSTRSRTRAAPSPAA